MKIERTKNAKRNIVWGMIEKITVLLLPFICRTVIIEILGAEYIGLNSLFTSILSVLSISELGFGSAIVFSMYKPIAEGDNDTVCALMNVYKKIYQVIGTIILVVGLCIIPFLSKLIKGDVPSDVNLYVLYGVHLFDTVVGYYLFAYKAAIFSAYQRNDLISKRSTFVSLIGNILKIIGLVVFRTYYAFVLVLPFITIFTNLANAMLAKKMFPKIVCKGKISNEMKDGIKKRMVGLISFKIYNVIFTSVDTIIISSYLGLTPLAIYNNYYYIQTSIVSFMTIFTASITAGIGNKMITNSIEDNYSDFKNFTFANGWICSWCAVCLVCLYQPFMKVWVGESLLFPLSTMILMVFYFFLPRLTTMTYTYREAAGLWWEDRFRPLVATAVNLITNIILVKFIGINGVIISTLICTIFINVPWGSIILFKNYFKISIAEYFGQLIYYTVITSIVGGISFGICYFIKIDGLIGLGVKAVVCLIVPNILFWLFYKNKKEFDYTRRLFVGILSKFRKV
ncbi:MAG: polysaccharide biosynthesis protein [Ruminococcus flavefaciens]|nr:polysaccharide biosynthesis protein [Ruminococcus flavefaciens]